MKQSEHDLSRCFSRFYFTSLSKSLDSVEKVSYINGEPVELLSEMLAKRARSGTTTDHRNIKDNAVLSGICEKIAKGDLDDSDEEDVPGMVVNP